VFKNLKKLTYGVRVLLSKGAGESQIVDVAGRRTVIKHAGQGTPFVYLHSALDESTLWLPFYQRLAQSFHVIVPTHPGFETLANLEQIDSIADMAFHYVELFDALGLGEMILGGVSLGGWIAAEFAVRWPERVKRLWIADAPGLWVQDEPLADLFRIMNDREKLRQLLFFDPHSAMASLILSDRADEEKMLHAYQSLTVLARLVWERPYDPKLASRLYRIACPTLLLWGDHDRLVPPAYGKAYQEHISGSRLTLIKDCGHLPMFEKEKEFVDTLLEFCLE
jgi:pimeloyl-ACP methyl ester carboxylesterase